MEVHSGGEDLLQIGESYRRRGDIIMVAEIDECIAMRIGRDPPV